MNDPTGLARNRMNRDNGYRNEACPACLSADIHAYHQIDIYRILKCSNCGHVFVEDTPSDFELYEFYEGAYQDGGEFQPKLRWHRKLKYWAIGRYLKSLFPGKRKIRLLEIGCSQGDLLQAVAGDSQFESRGIDYASGPVEYARSQGLDVDQGSLEGMNFPDESFNLVVAIHVVEHMQNPERSMLEVKRILEQDGYFLAVVPCISHIKAKRKGFSWKYWGPPGHLWYFTTRSFSALLERLGFEVRYSSCINNQAHMRILARKP
ncbi:class I SAM-dependent methyltransferase [Gemmatimonadota bacterium]